ncbi:MAG: cytochrome [Bdellovibrionota bacterium]
MFIQGNLQVVFDALYSVGAIDPVLGMDWEKINSEMSDFPHLVNKVCSRINACAGDHKLLVETLKTFEPRLLNFVALEVAREFCEYQDRKELH